MTTSELITKLSLPEETEAALLALPLPENFVQLTESFHSGTELFSAYAAQNNGLAVLRLYLEWALDTKTRYDELGIPQSYFWGSIRDITIWCHDYWDKHHTPGFVEWEWLAKTLRLNVIRIGRLQFEPTTLTQDVTLDGQFFPAGMPMLDVHIPAGEPLDQEAVLESMTQAPEFFRTYFDKEFSLFHCHSWLLSPSLAGLLPMNSRIMQFQNLFTVYRTDGERQAEERVFGFLSDDPSAYPEATSLQKSIKNHLLTGKTVEMGAGLRLM